MNSKTLWLALLLSSAATFSLQAQTTEELQLMYMSFLEKQGIEGTIDSDGDVQFTYEELVYFFGVDADDPEFFRLVLPNIWPIENEMERLQVLKAMDIANARIKVAKIYMVEDNIWVGVEILQRKVGDFEAYFDRSLELIQQCIVYFRDEMRK
jgi:hypothetical protein